MRLNDTPQSAAGKPGPKITPITLTCKGCSRPFVARTADEKKKTYCSRTCYHQSRERLITCERCGGTFKRRDSVKRPSRFCSNACKRSGWDIPALCAQCGEMFTPTRQKQRCCSMRCAALLRHAQDLEGGKRIEHPEVTCRYCGRVFRDFPSATQRPDRPRVYCSKRCKHAGQRTDPARQRQRKTEREARRRAQKRINGPIETIDTQIVIARDGNICHLCERPIDLTLSGWNPMGFTIDHVMPLARGGSHTLDNVKPAHRLCNMRKRARTLEEYRLS